MSLVEGLARALEAVPSHPEAPCWVEGPALWTSDAKRDRQAASVKCHACPIMRACRAGAAARNERHGTWGGVDVETLYRDRYRDPARPRRPKAECGTRNGYQAHRRKPEPACAPCRAANYQYEAEGRRRRRQAAVALQAAQSRVHRRLPRH